MTGRIAILLLVACERSIPPTPPTPTPTPTPSPSPSPSPSPPQAAPRPPITAPPRLGHDGFEGMSANEMASRDALERAFSNTHVERHDPRQLMLFRNGLRIATIDVDPGPLAAGPAKAYKVALVAPGIVTTHGLAVGDRLVDVLDVDAHRCETIWGYTSSVSAAGAVRCWVGTRFRYVAHLSEPPWAFASASAFENFPSDGPALDRWIEASNQTIDLILWTREPAR